MGQWLYKQCGYLPTDTYMYMVSSPTTCVCANIISTITSILPTAWPAVNGESYLAGGG